MGGMRIVIYAGMGKTGSTTIQGTFGALRQEVCAYAPAGTRTGKNDHNRLFSLCFSPEDNIEDAFLHSGDNQQQLRQKRAAMRQALDEAIAANTRPLFMFATELLVGAREATLQRFADYCRSHTDDIEVYAYVRPPVSYMQSMLPQNLRTSASRQVPLLHWPDYRRGFEPLDACFGRERVHLFAYDRARLKGGDVALDLAARMGVPLQASQVIHANESVPLTATALLYAFRTLLPQRRPTPWRRNRRNAFVEALSRLGSGEKLRFAPELVGPLLERESADLEWMEARLGEQLADLPTAATGQIASAEDLLHIAERHVEAVEALAGQRAPAGASVRQRLLYALCTLYDRRG